MFTARDRQRIHSTRSRTRSRGSPGRSHADDGRPNVRSGDRIPLSSTRFLENLVCNRKEEKRSRKTALSARRADTRNDDFGGRTPSARYLPRFISQSRRILYGGGGSGAGRPNTS